MEFTGTWITDDTDCLTETCEILVPTSSQSTDSTLGLGGISAETGINRHVLSCMEVPESVVVNYNQGVRVVLEMDLVIDDPAGYIEPQRAIVYSGQQYRITRRIAAQQHTLKRVGLEHMGAA